MFQNFINWFFSRAQSPCCSFSLFKLGRLKSSILLAWQCFFKKLFKSDNWGPHCWPFFLSIYLSVIIKTFLFDVRIWRPHFKHWFASICPSRNHSNSYMHTLLFISLAHTKSCRPMTTITLNRPRNSEFISLLVITNNNSALKNEFYFIRSQTSHQLPCTCHWLDNSVCLSYWNCCLLCNILLISALKFLIAYSIIANILVYWYRWNLFSLLTVLLL